MLFPIEEMSVEDRERLEEERNRIRSINYKSVQAEKDANRGFVTLWREISEGYSEES